MKHDKGNDRGLMDLTKWKDIMCSWSRKLNIMKMVTLPKGVYIFNANINKILVAIFP